jgi:hypothetical protein
MKVIASFRHFRNQARRARSARYRPRVETLEARTVPSVFKPIGIAGVGPFAGSPASALAGFNVNTDTVDTISNETSFAVNPTNTNNLIGSANDYQIDPVTFAETVISNAHVSFDGGATWTVYQIPSFKYTGTGDPGIAFDATGRAYASFLGDYVDKNTYPDVWATTSTDGGKTWANKDVVATNLTTPTGAGIFNDKPYIAAWGNGNAIITYTNFNLGKGGSYQSSPIMASVTHDGGHTWSNPTNISGPVNFDQGSVPVVAADGSISVTFFGSSSTSDPRDHEWVVKVDPAKGRPIGNPVAVGVIFDGFGDFPINNSSDNRPTLQDSQFRVSLIQGNIAADPTNAAHLAVDWFDCRNGLPTSPNPYATTTNSDIIVSQSFDGGATWSTPQALAIPNDQFMPWAVYDSTGHLQIGFFDRQYDSANHLYGYTLASETSPGSLSFTTQQVSTALSDPTMNDAWFRRTINAAFPKATAFIGDYSNIAILGNGGVGAFWTDLRDPATFPGRVGQHTEESFFGDPQTGSSTNPLIGALTPSHTAGTVTNQASSRSLDSFYAGLASSLTIGSASSSNTKSSESHSTETSSSGNLLAMLGWRLGLGDDGLDPLA